MTLYQSQVHHGQLTDVDHILDVGPCFHESHLFTPSDLCQ